MAARSSISSRKAVFPSQSHPLASRVGGSSCVSSQYVSSILLCAPYAEEPVTLELTGGQIISQPYIDMTMVIMRTFGIEVVRERDPATGRLLEMYIIPQAMYRNPQDYNIESDASSATYPLAVAAITGSTCIIANIGSASLQDRDRDDSAGPRRSVPADRQQRSGYGYRKEVLELGATAIRQSGVTMAAAPPSAPRTLARSVWKSPLLPLSSPRLCLHLALMPSEVAKFQNLDTLYWHMECHSGLG